MIVITCLDQKNGMMFNHRRQSQDSVLREHVAKLVANVPLWMNHYSASQFDTESIPNLNKDANLRCSQEKSKEPRKHLGSLVKTAYFFIFRLALAVMALITAYQPQIHR